MMMTSRTSLTACASLQDLPTPQPILGRGDSRLALERYSRDELRVGRRATASYHPHLSRHRDDVSGESVVAGLVHQAGRGAAGDRGDAPGKLGRRPVAAGGGRGRGGGGRGGRRRAGRVGGRGGIL